MLSKNSSHMAQDHPDYMDSPRYTRQESPWGPSSAPLGPPHRLTEYLASMLGCQGNSHTMWGILKTLHTAHSPCQPKRHLVALTLSRSSLTCWLRMLYIFSIGNFMKTASNFSNHIHSSLLFCFSSQFCLQMDEVAMGWPLCLQLLASSWRTLKKWHAAG
jgi:hypothetical protein